MALRFKVNGAGPTAFDQLTKAGTTTRLDVHGITLEVQYGSGEPSPAVLAFSCKVPQHFLPFDHMDLVEFFDTAYSTTLPLFRGHVRRQIPAESMLVKVVCHDPTARIADATVCTNTLCTDPTAIPRVVYNVTVDADEDKGYEQLTYPLAVTPYGIIPVYATVQQILENIWGFQQPKLNSFHAPGGLNVADLSQMTYQVQDKQVFDTENLVSATGRLLQLYPAYRVWYDPEGADNTGQFRAADVTEAPAVTLALNDPDEPHPVLVFSIEPSLEKRYTAFRLVGKPETAYATAKLSDGSLTPLAMPGETAPAPNVYRRFQVTDPAKRHLWRHIRPARPEQIVDPQGYAGALTTFKWFDEAALLVAFPSDEGQQFQVVNQIQINVSAGEFRASGYLHKRGGNNNQNIVAPQDVKALFMYHLPADSVRYPETGHEGSAYTAHGVTDEKIVYHELFNTGFLYWDRTTRQEKRNQYYKLARNALKGFRDTIYSGTAVLHGKDYRWLRLNKKVNFTSRTRHGAPLTTGWESANAIVTHILYDYDKAGQTTIMYNSDLSSFDEMDNVELRRLKMRIKAKAVYREFFTNYSTLTRGATGDYEGTMTTGFTTVRVGMEG